MVAMNLNTNTYPMTATNTSSSVLLSPQDTNQTSVIVYNAGPSAATVLSGTAGTAGTGQVTAVFPTSSAAPGKVVAAGAYLTFTKKENHERIAAITSSSSALLYLSLGAGE